MATIKSFEDFLDRMQELLDNAKKQGHIIVRVEDLENAFPELVESEDDRIRNEIIAFVEQAIHRGGGTPIPQEQEDRWIAWLEKQNPADTGDSSIINGKEFPASEKRDFGYFEENSFDKAEPNFKIEKGKWYVCTQTFVLRGKEVIIKGRTYQADEKDNVIKGEDGCLFIDRHDGEASDYLRSWNLKDAKDGDILATWAGAFIYNGNNGGGGCPGSHCGINTLGRFKTGVKTHWTSKKVYPATKEQRDLLFQKMHEAGYEWDAEKKVSRNLLGGVKRTKKIEQKPTDNDIKEALRTEYEKGRADAFAEYQKAAKDLELTWEDIRELYIVFAEVDTEIELCKTDIKTETLGYYQEVLKRFKERK